MEKEYSITHEQLEQIEHFKNMFDTHADLIQDLCKNEKDDIVYGFELGRIHSNLRDCFIDMKDLVESIKNRTIEHETN